MKSSRTYYLGLLLLLFPLLSSAQVDETELKNKIYEARNDNDARLLKLWTEEYRENCKRQRISCSHKELVDLFEIEFMKTTDVKKSKSFIKICEQFLDNFPNSTYRPYVLNKIQVLSGNKSKGLKAKLCDEILSLETEEQLEEAYEASQKAISKSCAKKIERKLVPLKLSYELDSRTANFCLCKAKFKGLEGKFPVITTLNNYSQEAQADYFYKDSIFHFIIPDASKKSFQVEVSDTKWKKDTIVMECLAQQYISENEIYDDYIDISRIVEGFPLTLDVSSGEGSILSRKILETKPNLSLGVLKLLNLHDSLNIVIVDNNQVTLHNETIYRNKTFFEKIPSWFLGILLLPLMYWFINLFKEKKRAKVVVKASSETTSTPVIPVQNDHKKVVLPETTIAPVPIIKEEPKSITVGEEERSKIKIKKSKSEKSINFKDFGSLSDYKSISLKRVWEDTMINKVHLSQRFIDQLEDYLVYSTDGIPLDTIPEKGGFVLGYVSQNEDGTYNLTIEDLLSASAEESGRYQFGYSIESWTRLESHLEEANDKHLNLIGWFHTHPGHGIFLSRPDINISENFFNLPHQIAVELDNYQRDENPRFDFGIFSLKRSGKVNNKVDLLTDWFKLEDYLS